MVNAFDLVAISHDPHRPEVEAFLWRQSSTRMTQTIHRHSEALLLPLAKSSPGLLLFQKLDSLHPRVLVSLQLEVKNGSPEDLDLTECQGGWIAAASKM